MLGDLYFIVKCRCGYTNLHYTVRYSCCIVYSLYTVHTHSYITYVCVSESEPPLSGLPENFSDSGLISLLRAELGLSSPDLFSMTVTDYDIKPNVCISSLFFVIVCDIYAFSCTEW